MDEDSIQLLYTWIDEIPLTRPKRNVARDFSDGVLAAECVAHFIPNFVELHNYTPANNSQQKRTNWDTLNRKVFKRVDFNVPTNIINGIILCKPGVIEIVLFNLRVKVLNYLAKKETEERESVTDDYKEYSYEQGGDSWRNNYQDTNIGQAYHGGAPYPNNQSYHGGPPNNQMNLQHNYRNYPPAQNKQYNPSSNGIPQSIPFDGEKPRKKKSSKKVSKIPVHPAAESQRSRSMPNNLDNESRIYIQEKEQALMQSHETIQILQAKISRLEHLLQLKDMRIEDLDMKLKNSLGGVQPHQRR